MDLSKAKDTVIWSFVSESYALGSKIQFRCSRAALNSNFYNVAINLHGAGGGRQHVYCLKQFHFKRVTQFFPHLVTFEVGSNDL